MPREFNEDRLVHYFAGECSEKEAAEIEAWICADPARKRRIARLHRIWDAADPMSKEGTDVDAMWGRFTRRLPVSEFGSTEPDDMQTGVKRSSRVRGDRRSRRARSTPGVWALLHSASSGWAVAAAVVIVAVATWVLYGGQVIDQYASSMRTIATEVGQQAQITLGDGTRVTLNAESELTLPPEFGDRRRRVRLRGQAYFEVASDKERPFLVHAGGSITQVLGTKFDVGAYPEDETVRIVVAEGAVSVRSERDEVESSVRLRERQMAALSKSGRSVVRQEVDPAPYLAWTKGQLVFQDASFDEVAHRLRSWYGLRLRVVGSVGTLDRLNATFNDEPVSEIIQVVAETLNLQYEREGDTVTFRVQE